MLDRDSLDDTDPEPISINYYNENVDLSDRGCYRIGKLGILNCRITIKPNCTLTKAANEMGVIVDPMSKKYIPFASIVSYGQSDNIGGIAYINNDNIIIFYMQAAVTSTTTITVTLYTTLCWVMN